MILSLKQSNINTITNLIFDNLNETKEILVSLLLNYMYDIIFYTINTTNYCNHQKIISNKYFYFILYELSNYNIINYNILLYYIRYQYQLNKSIKL